MQASSAHAEATVEEVAQELLGLWRHLIRASTTRELYALLDELDLSITHLKTLHLLAESPRAISIKELGEALTMSLPNASRTVDNLLQRGLLERHEDEHDRRIKRIAVTAAGRDVLERVDTARLHGLESWVAGLSPEQRRALLDALSSIPKDRRT